MANHAEAPRGVRIAWRVDGAGDAPPLLLCSMGTAAMAIWDEAAAEFGRTRRVIRYDRRGDGDSDAGPPESHSMDTHFTDAVLVLDAAGCERADVCGMAFGARIATALALRAPERVRRLVLFDATGGPPAPEERRRAGSQEAAALRRAAGLPVFPSDRRWFERRDPAGAAVGGRALAGHAEWTPGLERITAPTLIACGEQDPNLPGSQRMAREIPGAQFELMPMTGHASWLDRPDLVLALMRRFLNAP